MSTPDATFDGDESLAPHEQLAGAPGENSAGRLRGRYVLGEGADGVHDVRDRILDRGVRGRVVPTARADDLEQEARFLARLDHASAPAVLDFVRGDAGAMLVERRLEGPDLAQAIARARHGEAVPGIETPAAVVQTMLKVCDALAAAHARGVVHHDLRPAAIRLCQFGQVVISDWSTAISERRNPATIRYVSVAVDPQAHLLDGLHADVRAVGACLLAALTLRLPSDEDGLTAISPDERLRVPPQLEAVARRALGSDPTQGYRDIAALAADLRRCADGMLPIAYAPGVFARIAYWLGSRRRSLAAAMIALGVLAAAAMAVAWPHMRMSVAWQEVAREDFDGPAFRERWLEPPGAGAMFALRDGRVVSIAERDACLVFRRRLATPVAIEYSGEIIAGSPPCDLSVLWSENDGVADDPQRFLQEGRGYMIQAGAFGNTFCAIYQNPGRRLMAHANKQLEVGRRYRFRVELSGTRIAMDIDGERVLEAEDIFPSASGFVSLYGFYPGKAFDDVRIMQAEPKTPPSRLDAGDAAFHERRFEAASALYQRVAEADPASHDGQQALFRKGLAEWYRGRGGQAAKAWSGVVDPALAERIAGMRLESLFNTGQRGPHASWLEERYAADPARRPALRELWRQALQQQVEAPQHNQVAIDYLLEVQRRLFPDDATARFAAASALISQQRYQDVLSGFPEQRHQTARALLGLGRSAELIESPWLGSDERIHALGMRGEFERVLASPGAMPDWRMRVLLRLDRPGEALAAGGPYPALLFMGRGTQLLDDASLPPAAVNEALVSVGRLREAAGAGLPQHPGSGGSSTALLLLGQLDAAERLGGTQRHAIRFMVAVESGDEAAAMALRDKVTLPADLASSGPWFAQVMLVAFVDHLRGDRQALERHLRPLLPLLDGIYARTPWYVARVVLGDGPPETVLGIPARYEAEAWHHLAAGVRAEVVGDATAAASAYAAFTAMPMHRRLLNGNYPDADVEWFVGWRSRALEAARR